MSTMQEQFEAMLVLYYPCAEMMNFKNSEGVPEYYNAVENLAWKMWQAATEAAKAEKMNDDQPAMYCVPDKNGKPLFGKGWMFSPVPQMEATMPLYARPAAKATGTAGELSESQKIAMQYGQQLNDAEATAFVSGIELGKELAARHDKDGNHADDLRGMLDELQTEFDKQQSAFWACSEKLAQVQRNQETELSDIRILELAEEDFGEQDDRNVKNEDLLSFARRVQAARQPAPAVAVKTWESRLAGNPDRIFSEVVRRAMEAEISDLRVAVAASQQSKNLMAICEALRPFAEAYKPEHHTQTDDPKLQEFLDRNQITPNVTMGNFRRAHEAYLAATNRSQP